MMEMACCGDGEHGFVKDLGFEGCDERERV